MRPTSVTQDGITSARKRLTGGFAKDSEYQGVRAALTHMVSDKPALDAKLHAAKSILSACKNWIDQLPEGTTLEPVIVDVDGHDLAGVREKLKAAEAELATLA